jgi:dGTPase
MDWHQLLSAFRLGRDPAKQYKRRVERPPWQYDADRIIFSSAFRRLQDKTQVFPLSSSDYIRTRLTHSLEVASIARTLGSWVGFEIVKRHKLHKISHGLEFGMIASAAALAHDIGNPPFGHSGEDAIRTWFLKSDAVSSIRDLLTPLQVADISYYEGNAQGFRILTKLQMYRDRGGMQLTASTLAAFAKYPVSAPLDREERKKRGISWKKFNYFQSEAEAFQQVAAYTGLLARNEEPGAWARHPMSFVVEAADDLCYGILDLEDGYRQNLISFKDLRAALSPLAKQVEPKLNARLRAEPDDLSRVTLMRALSIGTVIEELVKAFVDKEPEILDGSFDKPIIEQVSSYPSLQRINELVRSNVYRHPPVLRVEATGYSVIYGLLETFTKAVLDHSRFRPKGQKVVPNQSDRLFKLIPRQFVGPKGIPSRSPYELLLGVLDYISGMTDSYALDLYRNIHGISLP